MSHARSMLEAYPGSFGFDAEQLSEAIDATTNCAQTSTACADACLAEEMVADLTRCIRLDLDCADVCLATSRVLSRQTAYDAQTTAALLEACVRSCRACGDECEGHAGMHAHCRICAEACRACEAACQRLLSAAA